MSVHALDHKVPVDADLWPDMASMQHELQEAAIRGMLAGIGALAVRADCHREAAKLVREIEKHRRTLNKAARPEVIPAFPCKQREPYPLWTDPIIAEAEDI